MDVVTLGVDLAKNVFQLHGVDRAGKPILRKRVRRAQLLATIAQLSPCLIGIEACPGAHYWARAFARFGHQVRLMGAQFVAPYRKGNKNDGNDAEAICEAVSRPGMRFVPAKSIEQQDLQMLQRIRENIIQTRTALINQIRGLLAERGIVIAKGIAKARNELPLILENGENELSDLARALLATLREELQHVDAYLASIDRRIVHQFSSNEACIRIAAISGVGVMTATAIVSSVGDARNFKNGRHLAAWLGLVPRQYASGDRSHMYGITRRGDKRLRSLLIHGARTVVHYAAKKHDPLSQWINRLRGKRGVNVAAVALANKMARWIWALLATGKTYQPQPL
jgi:transposase